MLQKGLLSLIAQLVRNPLQCRRPWFHSWVREIPWRSQATHSVFLGFPVAQTVKKSTCNARDLGSIPGLGRSSGGGHGNPLQYSCRENPYGPRAWRATAHGIHKELDSTEWLGTAQHMLQPCLPHSRAMCRWIALRWFQVQCCMSEQPFFNLYIYFNTY